MELLRKQALQWLAPRATCPGLRALFCLLQAGLKFSKLSFFWCISTLKICASCRRQTSPLSIAQCDWAEQRIFMDYHSHLGEQCSVEHVRPPPPAPCSRWALLGQEAPCGVQFEAGHAQLNTQG